MPPDMTPLVPSVRKDATDWSRADQSILIPFIYSSISGNSTSLPTAHVEAEPLPPE